MRFLSLDDNLLRMRTIPREVLYFHQMKSSFVISEIQKAVLIGTLLGNGSLNKRGKEYRLHIKHSTSQLSFVEYKREIFKNITSMPIHIFDQKVKDTLYHSAEFVTLTHSIFTEYYNLFYREGKKNIPENIIDVFTNPLSVAIWFMDDGSSEYAGAAFHTQCFTLLDLQILQKVFRNSFHIRTTLRKKQTRMDHLYT